MTILENILWRSLSGTHAHLTAGTASARRYARGYSPLIGFADPRNPDWAGLAPHCAPGEKFYCADWSGPEPKGWTIHVDASMCAMLWEGAKPEADPTLEPMRLGPFHVPQAMRLTELTRPGPFAERTVELGEWFGVFENGQLIAMAGERLQAGNLHEVSGICTHPDHQGRGLAKRLTDLMIRTQMERGEVPFLHVASANTRARALYERMGFRLDREVPMRVVSRNA
ncbi:hypothetical protein BWI17_07095 [Betaproteobacteria bacterium GR16-43]|nr:hypothetical protein BWI17_07095 [Betaproteobacteria bacterium GR16-43]